MKFLFVGPGFPDVAGVGSGSGIGRYMAELTAGLVGRGHECHVLVWATGQSRRGASDLRSGGTTAAGVKLHLLEHSYWPVVERIFPDSRDVCTLSKMVRLLDEKFNFDVIELESEEGIGIDVQREFGDRVLLRCHTTLRQMVEHKDVEKNSAVMRRLRREDDSIRLARRILVTTVYHQQQMKLLYPFAGQIDLSPIGIDLAGEDGVGSAAGNFVPERRARFLIIGTPDRRKGFDRLMPVFGSYVQRFGPCLAVIVADADETVRRRFGLTAPFPDGLDVIWKKNLSDDDLHAQYRQASALFHPARYESFGLPLIEAAGLGVPVVATETGVAGELLGGMPGGLLINGDDPVAAAEALAGAVAKRAEIGSELTRRYRVGFTRAIMTEKYLHCLVPREEENNFGYHINH